MNIRTEITQHWLWNTQTHTHTFVYVCTLYIDIYDNKRWTWKGNRNGFFQYSFYGLQFRPRSYAPALALPFIWSNIPCTKTMDHEAEHCYWHWDFEVFLAFLCFNSSVGVQPVQMVQILVGCCQVKGFTPSVAYGATQVGTLCHHAQCQRNNAHFHCQDGIHVQGRVDKDFSPHWHGSYGLQNIPGKCPLPALMFVALRSKWISQNEGTHPWTLSMIASLAQFVHSNEQ